MSLLFRNFTQKKNQDVIHWRQRHILYTYCTRRRQPEVSIEPETLRSRVQYFTASSANLVITLHNIVSI